MSPLLRLCRLVFVFIIFGQGLAQWWMDFEVNSRIVRLWVSVSHDLAAVPDVCAHAGNTCL